MIRDVRFILDVAITKFCKYFFFCSLYTLRSEIKLFLRFTTSLLVTVLSSTSSVNSIEDGFELGVIGSSMMGGFLHLGTALYDLT